MTTTAFSTADRVGHGRLHRAIVDTVRRTGQKRSAEVVPQFTARFTMLLSRLRGYALAWKQFGAVQGGKDPGDA